MDKETNGHLYIANDNLKRIADALEEVIRMVKKDQEDTRARFEERWDKEDNDKVQYSADTGSLGCCLR